MAEIANKSGGVKLREDNVLFMMAVKIKDICTQYDVFIMSSTQLNSDWQTSETPDQNLLRGAKSIADKIESLKANAMFIHAAYGFGIIDVGVLVLSTIILYFFSKTERNISRIEGFIMILIFIIYYSYVIFT